MPGPRRHLDNGWLGQYVSRARLAKQRLDKAYSNAKKVSTEKALNYNIGQSYNPAAYRKFIKDWYAQRSEQINRNISAAGATQDDWNNQMKNIDRYSWYASSNALPARIRNKLTANERNVGHVEGMAIPDYKVVYFNQPDSRKLGSSIQIHEGTHTQSPVIQQKAMKNKIHLQKDVYDSSYYDDLDEINSRLMEFRYANKLNPRRKYSIKEIKQMRDYGDGGASWSLGRRPLDILNRYSDDTLLFLINDLADNNKRNRTSNVYTAKYGGIHIDPANRGALTETMRRTGKTKYQLAHSKNPLTRKRAIFAINAAKWNHG